jgi:hypothetical protein
MPCLQITMDAGWDESDRMMQAALAADAQMAAQNPAPETVERWKRLFGYSYMEVLGLLGEQRGDGEEISRHEHVHASVHQIACYQAMQSPVSARD